MSTTANKVVTLCGRLERKGIVPAILLAGQEEKKEIENTHVTSSRKIENEKLKTFLVGGYKLHTIFLDIETFCEVHGNQRVVPEEPEAEQEQQEGTNVSE